MAFDEVIFQMCLGLSVCWRTCEEMLVFTFKTYGKSSL